MIAGWEDMSTSRGYFNAKTRRGKELPEVGGPKSELRNGNGKRNGEWREAGGQRKTATAEFTWINRMDRMKKGNERH